MLGEAQQHTPGMFLNTGAAAFRVQCADPTRAGLTPLKLLMVAIGGYRGGSRTGRRAAGRRLKMAQQVGIDAGAALILQRPTATGVCANSIIVSCAGAIGSLAHRRWHETRRRVTWEQAVWRLNGLDFAPMIDVATHLRVVCAGRRAAAFATEAAKAMAAMVLERGARGAGRRCDVRWAQARRWTT
jgi:hypothetical protein